MIGDASRTWRSKLESALRPMVDDPERFGLLLIGSNAMGLGNELSDIDVVAIDYSGRDYGMPARQLTHVGQQRCEIYFVSDNDLSELSRQFDDPPAFKTPEWDLFLRIAYGLPVQRAEQVEKSIAQFPRSRAQQTLSVHLERSIATALAQASKLNEIGLGDVGASLVRAAAGDMLRLLISREGTHLVTSEKYIETIADKVLAQSDVASCLLGIWRNRLPGDDGLCCQTACRIWEQLRDEACLVLPEAAFAWRDDVVLIDVLDMTAIRHGQSLYVIQPGFEAAYERLIGRGPNSDDLRDPGVRRALGDSLLSGLANVVVDGARFDFDLSRPDPALCRVSLRGFDWPSGYASTLYRVPLALEDLPALATSIYSAGIDFACSKEDAVGAIRSERWWEVDNSLKRMLRDLAVIEMAHHGVNIHILNWNFPLLRRAASEDRRFEHWRDILSQANAMTVSNRGEARALMELVSAARQRIPDHVLGMLERSTENGRVHEEVVVGLGTKIAKLRELVDGALWGNDKGYKRATNAFFAELQERADKNWSRTDDPLKELMD